MTVTSIKVKVQRKAIVKLKVLPRFASNITAASPILLDRTGGAFAFSLDINELLETFESIFAPISLLNEPTIVTASSATVAAGTLGIGIQRTAPAATALALPSVASQGGFPLRIFDWSTSVTDHTITLTPNGSEKIMLASTWPIYSTASSLGSLTLYPSIALNGWFIAP